MNCVGIDIGGTKCAAVLAEITGEQVRVRDKIRFATQAEKGPAYSLEKIFASFEELLLRAGLGFAEVSSVGISCGGPLSSRTGTIMSPPNLPGWDDVKIVEMFRRRYGVTARLQNDANACALAEWKFGAARGFDNAVFLTFGTGMGAGLVLDGRLYSGTSDGAGEVGHLRLAGHGPVGFGKSGSFEGFCSGGGIRQLAQTMVMEKLQMGRKVSFCPNLERLESLDAKLVAEAALAGDPLALEIYQISGEYLGRGLALLVDILNPQVIVIGSIFARSADLLWPHANRILQQEALPGSLKVCSVIPAHLGEQIGDYGALAAAVYEP